MLYPTQQAAGMLKREADHARPFVARPRRSQLTKEGKSAGTKERNLSSIIRMEGYPDQAVMETIHCRLEIEDEHDGAIDGW